MRSVLLILVLFDFDTLLGQWIRVCTLFDSMNTSKSFYNGKISCNNCCYFLLIYCDSNHVSLHVYVIDNSRSLK